MGEIDFPGCVESFKKNAIEVVSRPVRKANQVQWNGRHQFKVGARLDLLRKFLRETNVLSNVVLQTFYSIMAQHEPQLERAKATAKRDLPVAVIDHRARLG